MMRHDLLYYIALSKIPKVGPIIAKNLIAYCGGVSQIFEASEKELKQIPGIGPTLTEYIYKNSVLGEAEKEIHFIQKNNIQAITYQEAHYPQRLVHVESCPIVLYYKGNFDLNHYRTVAIVGTRNPTDYGKIMCERIVEGLSSYNTLVLSGLAFGIDSLAHQTCLHHNIPTIGRLGHGLDRIYPSEHKNLANKMMENGGILTEFTTNTRPDKENFPMRNRIIAAMSDGIIVVESKRKGGSIITADFANDFNKDVFAIPGPVIEEYSEGCNKLIKQNKAHLLESVEDIAYIMRWDEIDRSDKIIQKQLFVDLSPQEQAIVDLLKEEKELGIDIFTYKIGLPPSEVSSILLNLEFKGVIRTKPGKKFILA